MIAALALAMLFPHTIQCGTRLVGETQPRSSHTHPSEVEYDRRAVKGTETREKNVDRNVRNLKDHECVPCTPESPQLPNNNPSISIFI